MRITFDSNSGFGTLYIAHVGQYDFVRPIVVSSSLDSLERAVKDYLLRVRPLFPIKGEVIPSEVIHLVTSHTLLAIRGDTVFFNFDELRLQSWFVIRSPRGSEEESDSAFVSFVESDREWCKNELSDLRERLKAFAHSLGSDWFVSEE